MVDFSVVIEEQQVSLECVALVAQRRDVPQSVLFGILEQEGGRPGMVRKNKDGSIDVGVTQINTQWLDYFKEKYSIPMERIRDEPCLSVDVSGYIVQKEMRRTKGDFWRAVGNYHSRTPSHHWRYLGEIHPKIVKYHDYFMRGQVGR